MIQMSLIVEIVNLRLTRNSIFIIDFKSILLNNYSNTYLGA